MPEAKSVNDDPWLPDVTGVAFLMGNEGHGLTELQKSVCDYFVYIPHVTMIFILITIII